MTDRSGRRDGWKERSESRDQMADRSDHSRHKCIGAVATDEFIVSEQLKEIEKAKDEFFDELKNLKQNEEEFINELREKYGDGQINIQDGTFTSVPVPVS